MSNGIRHKITEESRQYVVEMVAGGADIKNIAAMLMIRPEYLKDKYAKEIATGLIPLGKLVRSAGIEAVQNGDVRAILFYEKSINGLKETERHELTGLDGAAIQLEQKITDAINKNISLATRKERGEELEDD